MYHSGTLACPTGFSFLAEQGAFHPWVKKPSTETRIGEWMFLGCVKGEPVRPGRFCSASRRACVQLRSGTCVLTRTWDKHRYSPDNKCMTEACLEHLSISTYACQRNFQNHSKKARACPPSTQGRHTGTGQARRHCPYTAAHVGDTDVGAHRRVRPGNGAGTQALPLRVAIPPKRPKARGFCLRANLA